MKSNEKEKSELSVHGGHVWFTASWSNMASFLSIRAWGNAKERTADVAQSIYNGFVFLWVFLFSLSVMSWNFADFHLRPSITALVLKVNIVLTFRMNFRHNHNPWINFSEPLQSVLSVQTSKWPSSQSFPTYISARDKAAARRAMFEIRKLGTTR